MRFVNVFKSAENLLVIHAEPNEIITSHCKNIHPRWLTLVRSVLDNTKLPKKKKSYLFHVFNFHILIYQIITIMHNRKKSSVFKLGSALLWFLKDIYPLQLCHQILPVVYSYRHCAFTFQLKKTPLSFCLLWLTFWSSVIFLLLRETKHPGSQGKPIQQDINICYSENLNEGLVILN